MKKDFSLHYQKTNKMEYTDKQFTNDEIRSRLHSLWISIAPFVNEPMFKQMDIKHKREFNKIEDKLFRLMKSYYK